MRSPRGSRRASPTRRSTRHWMSASQAWICSFATGRPLGPGTLYAALARLEERGFIEALEPVDRRRPYRLTGLGSTVLAEQLLQLADFAKLGLRRLGDASS